MKHGLFFTDSESITAAYYISLFRESLCLYVYPSFVVRQRLGNNFAVVTKAHERNIIVNVVFYEVLVVARRVAE
jgi:hypothetical protein